MNVLFISDIHIGDYPDYEYRRFQRLDNYPLYAKRICQIAKENGVQYLFILGDTTDQPTNRPYIQRRLKQVFSIFSNYFKKVFYILGQHDLDSRLFDYKSPDSTSIHLFAPDNFEYINRKIIQLGGRTIAAADFSDDQDLSWIIKPVDIFLGHVTINTSGFGQEIDYSKFTIGFAGDIHYPCSKNNLHSIGMSVQRYFSDAVDGTCVLLNLDNLSWKRILVDADRELFTRYLKVPDESQEGFSAELNSQGVPKEFRVYSPNTTEASEEIVTTVDSRATTINEVAEELCKANKISDVLGVVQSKYVDTGFVDLNFKLKKLYIENVRSIEKAEIDFEKLGGVSFIQGNNGCFVGSTKVMTLDGSYETLENLYKSKATKIPVYSYDAEEGELEILYAESCQLTKYVDELVRITLDNGDSYECTLDHLWLTVNEGFKKAIDLKEGDALMPLHRFRASHKFYAHRDSSEYEHMYALNRKDAEMTHHAAAFLLDPNYKEKNLIVHHNSKTPDGEWSRTDNRPEKLLLMNWSDHVSLHNRDARERGIKMGFRSETVSRFNEEERVYYGKVRKLLYIALCEGEVDDEYTLNEELYEQWRTKYIELGYIHYGVPHWNFIIEEKLDFDQLWCDSEYERPYDYKDPEYIKQNLDEKYANSSRMSEFNALYHPNLRSDVTLEAVIKAAKDLGDYSVMKLAKYFDCSRTKINTVIYSKYETIQDFAEDNGFEYYNHKVVSVEVISKPNTPVYDLVNIPNSHDFAICDKDINSGVFVHNSGKSSAIWALNYALRGGLDIRDEVRIGQDFAMVYLILEYQGKEYAIYRGTDGVNFEINGQAQEFRNKRSTEAGIYEALPFINYLDSFFFMDDAVSILGSYSSERRIELLSVYYRLDIISKYYQIAEGLRGELYQSYQKLSATRDEELKKLEAILDQLDRCEKTVQKNGSINIDTLNSSIESLTKELRDSIAFEEEAKKFNESRVRNDLADAKRKLSTTLSRIKFAKEQLAIEVRTDLTDQSKILSSLDSDLDILKNEGQRLEGEVSKLKIKLESLKQVTCPNCDSSFYVSGVSILDKTALGTSLKLTQEELESTYSEFKLKKDKFKEHKDLQKEYLDNQEKLAAIKSYKESLPALEETARMLESKIDASEEQLKKFLENAAPVTSVSIQKKLDSLKSQLALIISCEELAESIMDWKFSDNFEEKLKSLENQIVQLDKFLYLFSNNGEVYKRILQNIVKGFSSSEFEYSVVDSVYRGNTFTDITCNYKAPESKAYIEYARLSRGQKTLVDLDFIKNLVKGTGIIVFDEILKFLSPANQIKGNLIIKSMKAPLKLVTTQGDNFTYVDHVILAEYENNVTTFKLK